MQKRPKKQWYEFFQIDVGDPVGSPMYYIKIFLAVMGLAWLVAVAWLFVEFLFESQ